MKIYYPQKIANLTNQNWAQFNVSLCTGPNNVNMYHNNFDAKIFAKTIWIWDGHRSPIFVIFVLVRLHSPAMALWLQAMSDHYANIRCEQIKFTLNPNKMVYIHDAYIYSDSNKDQMTTAVSCAIINADPKHSPNLYAIGKKFLCFSSFISSLR